LYSLLLAVALNHAITRASADEIGKSMVAFVTPPAAEPVVVQQRNDSDLVSLTSLDELADVPEPALADHSSLDCAAPQTFSGPCTGDACGCCRCCCNGSACWTVRADALWLKPQFGPGQVLGQTIAPGGTVIDTLRFDDANIQPGVRLQLIRQVDRVTSWELMYFGLQQWSVSEAITPDPLGIGSAAFSPYLQSIPLLGGTGLEGPLKFNYGANLHNAELNRRRQFQGSNWAFSRLAGFRYIQWNDTFNLIGTDPLFGIVESIDTRTYNYLVGSQLGWGARRDWSRLSLNLEGKAGLFANFLQQRRSNLNSTGVNGGFPAITAFDESHSTTSVAGVLDASAIVGYQLSRRLAVRGGYQVLYLPGVALASNQLAGLSRSGDPLLHGPSLGLESRW
jgi:hypothetical protein